MKYMFAKRQEVSFLLVRHKWRKMGKQISYWMDYDSFLLVAQKAVDLGCTVVKEDLELGKVFEREDISIITPDERRYYFHLPEAGDIEVENENGREWLSTAAGNAVIEAGYSNILNEPAGFAGRQRKKEILRARLYCTTGYYDQNEVYIKRPDCLTNVYHSLVRYVKKIAPDTEITDMRISAKDGNDSKKYEHRYKVYITKTCLDLVNNEGYKIY